MNKPSCTHCGCTVLIRGCISLRCPHCGEVYYKKEAGENELWAEHRIGLLYRSGGWSMMDVLEAPTWFLENVV